MTLEGHHCLNARLFKVVLRTVSIDGNNPQSQQWLIVWPLQFVLTTTACTITRIGRWRSPPVKEVVLACPWVWVFSGVPRSWHCLFFQRARCWLRVVLYTRQRLFRYRWIDSSYFPFSAHCRFSFTSLFLFHFFPFRLSVHLCFNVTSM